MLEAFSTFWFEYLYQPTFNLLIWVYNNWTDQSMGWAVVYVTAVIQVALFPFTLIIERNKFRNRALMAEMKRIDREYAKDPVMKKEEIRKLLKKRRFSPWSKAWYFAIQGVFIILLYQVFKDGIQGKNIVELLYRNVDFPGAINSVFYGVELNAERTLAWPIAVVALVYVEILFDFRKRNGKLKKSDLTYFLLFPTAILVTLHILPMVKSLYVIVSMLVAIVLGLFAKGIFQVTSKEAKT